MTRTEELLQEALALPTADRERILDALAHSLDDDDDLAILEDRIATMLKHPTRTAPIDEALASIRAAFTHRRKQLDDITDA